MRVGSIAFLVASPRKKCLNVRESALMIEMSSTDPFLCSRSMLELGV